MGTILYWLVLLVVATACGNALAQTPPPPRPASPPSAIQIISSLRDKLYVVGETSGRPENFQAAIDNILDALHNAAAAAGPDFLLERTEAGTTPLLAASYLGYPAVVEDLLKNPRVRAGVGEPDRHGYSAWSYANLAIEQSAWLCNPGVFQNPFQLVPLLVVQPYYLTGTQSPYWRTRALLEAAGAKPDIAAARQIFLTICTNAEAEARSAVASSQDVLRTILTESRAKLEALKRQRQQGSQPQASPK